MSAAPHLVDPSTGTDARLAALADALRSERRLLEELTRVMRSQRTGVASNDLGAVDESVYAAQRVLLTLQQARLRRRNLLQLLGGREDTGLADLESLLGRAMTDELRDARDDLRTAARALARELSVNREIIHGALAVGDHLLRAIAGVSERPQVYAPGPHGSAEAAAGGGLLDTHA